MQTKTLSSDNRVRHITFHAIYLQFFPCRESERLLGKTFVLQKMEISLEYILIKQNRAVKNDSRVARRAFITKHENFNLLGLQNNTEMCFFLSIAVVVVVYLFQSLVFFFFFTSLKRSSK